MKNLLIISVLLFSFTMCAQTFVPDDNFEQALIDLGLDTPPLDDFVPTENIDGLQFLNVNGAGISDLTGIEDFVALVELIAPFNNLTSIDVSQNTNLESLNLSESSISSIDLSNNTNLKELNMIGNGLGSIDFSQNSLLESFFGENNNLIALDVSNNPNLIDLLIGENFIDSIDVSQNSLLELLDIDNNNITSINVTQNPSLRGLGFRNNSVSSLDVTQNPLLMGLDCSNNNLGEIDISQNPNLINLRCDNTDIQALDVTNNPLITDLNAGNNNLISIDLSNNPSLMFLGLGFNSLTELDISSNLNVEGVFVPGNNLEILNIKNGNNTNFGFLNALDNPNLFCIEVDDPAYAEANFTDVDPQVMFSEECEILSVNKVNTHSITFFPNPVHNVLHIDSTKQIKNVQLTNLLGQIVLSTDKSNIEVSSLKEGLYTVSIVFNDGSTTFGKILKIP